MTGFILLSFIVYELDICRSPSYFYFYLFIDIF